MLAHKIFKQAPLKKLIFEVRQTVITNVQFPVRQNNKTDTSKNPIGYKFCLDLHLTHT